MRYVYLYPYSYTEAKREREVGLWHASYNENVRCKKTIEGEIKKRYDGKHLDGSIAKDLCEAYGVDRIRWVLSNTVNELRYDGRFRPENKEWAKTLYIPRSPYNLNFRVDSHPEVVNGLIDQYRRYVRDELGMFDGSHCLHFEERQNYEGKLLILLPEFLSDELKNGRYQLFFATHGNGCDPDKSGRKVYGFMLDSGNKQYFYRHDFLGIADESKLPEWAMEKLEEYRSTQASEEGMVMS